MTTFLPLHRNEYLFLHHPKVLEASQAAASLPQALSFYPNPKDVQLLKEMLGSYLEWPWSNSPVELFHGAEDALTKLLAWFRQNHTTLMCEDVSWGNTYRLGRGFGYNLVLVPSMETAQGFLFPKESFHEALQKQTTPAVVMIATPNNPTGHDASLEDLEDLVQCYPQHTFVLDRVYGPLSLKEMASFGAYPHVFVLGSLSKFFGLPGLRIGYALGQSLPEAFSMHLGLSYHALNVGLAALAEKDFYQKNRDEGRSYVQALAQMEFQNVTCLPSQATFVYAKLRLGCDIALIQKKEAEHHLCTKHIVTDDQVHYLRFCLGPQDVYQRIVRFLKSLSIHENL